MHPRLVDLPYGFTRRQATEAGLSDDRLARLVERGEVLRVRRGVYQAASPPPWERRRAAYLQMVRAELAAHGPRYAASHLSAAAVFRLPLPLGDLPAVHLTAVEATQRTRSKPGVVVHHCDSMENATVVVSGIRVAAAARTVADCLRCHGPRVSVPVADAALHAGTARLPDVVEVLRDQSRWRGHRRAVRSLGVVDGRRESWLESTAFVCFDEWGVPLPEPQVAVLDASGRFVARCDGGWLAEATMLELDGRAKYQLPVDGVVDGWAALHREKVRGDALGNLGLERVRFGLTDLLRGPAGVVDVVDQRRRVGSAARFSGSFRVADPTGLRLSGLSRG